MKSPTILAFSGSCRKGSYNSSALRLAVEGAEAAGAQVTVISLDDYQLPLYNGDLEAAEGVPSGARQLQQILNDHDALLIASPEYNGLPTPLLINTIDWVSRDVPESLSPYKGKTAAILSASPGGYGGVRSLTHLRTFLGNLGANVIEDQVSVAKAHEVFPEDSPAEEGQATALRALGATLVQALTPAD